MRGRHFTFVVTLPNGDDDDEEDKGVEAEKDEDGSVKVVSGTC
jgi:hypothetical protein